MDDSLIRMDGEMDGWVGYSLLHVDISRRFKKSLWQLWDR